MDGSIRTQVEAIHNGGVRFALAVTGGGARAVTWLIGVPGASKSILDVQVPYSHEALEGYLGYSVEQAVTAKVAVDMARAASTRAKCLVPDIPMIVAVGCTAGIATNRPKRGEHLCYVSLSTPLGATVHRLAFVKGIRGRDGEDDLVSRLNLRAVADGIGVPFGLDLALEAGEQIEVSFENLAVLIEALQRGRVRSAYVASDGSISAGQSVRGGVLSGSFDPLHEGHKGLAFAASHLLGQPVTFELSITNVDKSPLDVSDVERRIGQFAGKYDVVVTQATRFVDKARLFPCCTFVVGWDTAVRLVAPSYYDGDASLIAKALAEIRSRGCRFLVAGRSDDTGFHTLSELSVPSGFESMFTTISESDFRSDVSSTKLRMANQGR